MGWKKILRKQSQSQICWSVWMFCLSRFLYSWRILSLPYTYNIISFLPYPCLMEFCTPCGILFVWPINDRIFKSKKKIFFLFEIFVKLKMDYQQQVICSYFLKSLPTRSFPLPDSLRFFFRLLILMAPEIKIFMIWQWFGAVWIGDMNGVWSFWSWTIRKVSLIP